MSWHVWVIVAAVVVALGVYGDRVQKQQSSDERRIADSVAAGVASAVDIDDIAERVAVRLEPGRAVNVDVVADKVRRMLERDIAHRVAEAVADMQDTIICTVTDAVKASAVAPMEVSEQSPNVFHDSRPIHDEDAVVGSPDVFHDSIHEDAVVEFPTNRLFRQSIHVLPQELQAMGIWDGAEFAVADGVKLDVSKVPHWLIAGATGQGKSSMLNTILLQAIQRNPEELNLVLLDPKRVEFAAYQDVPHLWQPVATEMGDMIDVLELLVKEMEKRYTAIQAAGKRSIDGLGMPRILCVVDELGDLMLQQGKIVEPLLIRLTQLGRAAGIHVIAATQRPSVDVVTGVLKANLPGRIALRTASATDSRVIIDKSGAEKLRKPGEFILVSGVEEERGRGVFVDEEVIARAA